MPSKRNTKRLKFVGTHPKLQTGMYYTVYEFAEAAGVDYKRLHNKMSRHPVMTDELLKPYVPSPPLAVRVVEDPLLIVTAFVFNVTGSKTPEEAVTPTT